MESWRSRAQPLWGSPADLGEIVKSMPDQRAQGSQLAYRTPYETTYVVPVELTDPTLDSVQLARPLSDIQAVVFTRWQVWGAALTGGRPTFRYFVVECPELINPGLINGLTSTASRFGIPLFLTGQDSVGSFNGDGYQQGAGGRVTRLERNMASSGTVREISLRVHRPDGTIAQSGDFEAINLEFVVWTSPLARRENAPEQILRRA